MLAKEYIGETAELDFRKPVMKDGEAEWIATGLTGKDLSKANLSTNSQNGQWVVDLEFNGAGTKKFADLTKQHPPDAYRLPDWETPLLKHHTHHQMHAGAPGLSL